MKALVTATFEIDVTDWNKGEGLSLAQRKKKIEEDLEDFSVFMPHFDYEKFRKVEVKLKD